MSLLFLHPMPALFHQEQQATSWFVILLQRTETISVMHQQLQQQFPINGIALASGWVQGLTKLTSCLRMDRIDLDTYISKASKRRPRVFARWRLLFADHSVGSSTDRAKDPMPLAFAPGALAPALRCRSIAVPKRAPDLPNQTQPRLRSARRDPRYLFASSCFCSAITLGKQASHLQRTYRCRAGIQRQLLRIRLSEAHPAARGSLRKHQNC